MIAFLSLFLHVLILPFKTQARLEAEIVLLRHQLNVLRRRIPSRPKLGAPDRLLLVWLYRLFPSTSSPLSSQRRSTEPSVCILKVMPHLEGLEKADYVQDVNQRGDPSGGDRYANIDFG